MLKLNKKIQRNYCFKAAIFSLAILAIMFAVWPMKTEAITRAGSYLLTEGNLTAEGAVKFTSGAGLNYVFKSDATGNASWLDLSTLFTNAGITSDDISEGGTNLYYTDAAVDARIDLQKGAFNGLATLDGTGKLTSGQLPALAINNTYVATSTAARDALVPNTGDVAIVADAGLGDSRSYIWDGGAWVELLTPLSLYLTKANNLSDLASTSAARTNLGLGSGNPGFGELLIGNGTDFTLANLTGTDNQIYINNAAGSITLSLPQDLHATATPTFSGLNLSTALTVAEGGTGIASYTAGDLIFASSSNVLAPLAVGLNGDVLTVVGGVPVWQVPSSTVETDPSAVLKATFTANGDLLVGTGTSTYAALSIGSNNDVLTIVGGVPTWQALGAIVESDPVFSPYLASTTLWDQAYSWGDHAGLYDLAGTAVSTVSAHGVTYNHSNYDTAYSWGDHALAGYLATETDPIFSPYIASTTNWDQAYDWGDHSLAGYLATETDPSAVLKTTFTANGDLLVGTGTSTYAALSIGSNNDILTVIGGVPVWQALSGSMALSAITAATTTNTINNNDNAQVWNWNLTTTDKAGFTFGENSPSTASGSPAILKASALAGSTAAPLFIKNLGVGNSLMVYDEESDATPFVVTETGQVGMGTNTFNVTNTEKLKVEAVSGSGNVIAGYGDIDAPLYLAMQNRNSGASAATAFAVTADDGTDTSNYMGVGITSSGFSDPTYGIAGPHDAFLFNVGDFTGTQGGNMVIGTGEPGMSIKFISGGGLSAANEQMRIDGAGNVGIHTTAPGSELDVKGTLRLSGATSGFVGFAPPAVASSTTYTLPSVDGGAGNVLITDGSGTLSWAGGVTSPFQRIGTTLSPVVAGDDITTSGDIYTTGTGAITSAGILIGNAGLTITGGDVNLTSTGTSTYSTLSGDLTIDSAAALNLGTASSTSVSIGNALTTTTVNGPLSVPKFIDFTPGAAPTYLEGRLFYDSAAKSLTSYADSTGLEMHFGRMLWLRVKNMTGSPLVQGKAVYINGDDGVGIPTVALAKADSITTAQVAGIVAENIPNGSYGYATLKGLLVNTDTSSFSAGDTIYLSATTAGDLTTTIPAAPNLSMPLGIVQVSNATTGSIEVNIAAFTTGTLTQGSLAFGGTNGFTTQDNTNFFWDNSTKRLGIGDNTPTASLVVGAGDLFQVFGATGNMTTQGDLTLSTGGGTIAATNGGLNLTSSGDGINFQASGSGATANIQIGAGGAGSATPDYLALDVKSTTGDPAGGTEGYMYYNTFDNKFRCYENAAWKDCDTAGVTSLQTAYNGGATISTSGSNIAFTLNTTDKFIASGTGSVELTPTGASSFTSGGALTLTGGTASTWSTVTGDLTLQGGSGTVSLGSSTNLASNAGLTISSGSGDITLQPAGTSTTANVQIGAGGAGSATPDLFALDVKSSAGDPGTGADGAMYYNESEEKFKCYVNGSWSDCDTTGGTANLQSAYNSGATITTSASTSIALTLTSGDFTASGAGSVSLTPTGASSFTSGGALTLTGGAASTWSTSAGALTITSASSTTWGTTAGDLTLQVAGAGTTGNIKIGSGGAGSATPDLFALDVKNTAGDPGGFKGAMYYNNSSDTFRCYEDGGWKDCGASAAAATNLQQAYTSGATITTASSSDLGLILASGNFTASGAGSVNLTPTGASSFTSGGPLTLTGGNTSTWGTTAGNLTLQVAGTGTTANIQIGAGGAGSATPDYLALDVKSTTGDPAGGTEGYMYYNTFDNKFRCYENASWKDCDTAGVTSLQTAYNGGATISTSGSNIAFTLNTTDKFIASGTGSVELTPTGALTLTSGATSTWSVTGAGNDLTIDAADVINLGTANSTSVSIGNATNITTINGALAIPGYIDFTSTSTPAYAEGRLFHNPDNSALSYYNDVNGVRMDLGRMLWLRVKNTTGTTIDAGQVVYINGDDGAGIATVALAKADDIATARAVGITAAAIADGDYGYATSRGNIPNLDTSSYSDGDPLYLSATTAGAITATKPASPNYAVFLGVVAISDATTGDIEANVTNYYAGSFTTGSVAFGAADGMTTQDNTNFFWDNSTKRLGIGDNTPTASLVVGAGDLFQVFGATGNMTTQGDLTLSTGGGTIAATDGGLNLTSSGDGINFQASGSGATANIQIGAGGVGSATPDYLALDVKSTTGDPAGGTEGYMYYNTFDNKFRCYENAAWKDCDTTGVTADSLNFTDFSDTMTVDATTVIDLGANNLSITSAGAGVLTLTSGAAATWGTNAGNLTLQAAGSGTVANVQIGVGGAGSATPDYLALDVKSTTGDPAGGTEGYMYYNTFDNKFRCYENAAWKDCDNSETKIAKSFGTAQGDLISFSAAGTPVILPAGALNGQILTTDSGTVSGLKWVTSSIGADTIDFTELSDNMTVDAATSISLGANNLTINANSTGDILLQDGATNRIQVLDDGTLTLTAGANSTWSSSAGALTITSNQAATWSTANGALALDAAAALNLGTTNATGVNISKTAVTTTINGLTVLGTNTTDYVDFNGYVNSDIIPSADNTYDLGTSLLRWQDAYIKGGSLHVGNDGDDVTIGYSAANDAMTLDKTLQVAALGSTPASTLNGSMYYDTGLAKFRCYENGAWKDCDTSGSSSLPAGTTNYTLRYDGAAWASSGYLQNTGSAAQVGLNGTDGSLILYSEQGGTDYNVTFNPNAAMTMSTTYTLPADDGTTNQALVTDGSGNLSWSSAPSLSGVSANKYKTANETNTTGVLQNDDHLFFSIGANEVWTVTFNLSLNFAAARDFIAAVTAPAGATCNVSTAVIKGGVATSNIGCGVSSGQLATSGSDEPVRVTATIVNGATPGTVNLQWAQYSAGAASTVYSLSSMNAQKVQ